MSDRLVVNRLGTVFNTAGYLSGADVFATDLRPQGDESALRITVAVNTSGVMSIQYDSGAATVSANLNQGAALIANAIYTFTVGSANAHAVNFQFAANETILLLYVDEVFGAVL